MASSKEVNENIIKKIIKKIFSLLKYRIVRINSFNERYVNFIVECNEDEEKDLDKASKMALSSVPNLWSIIQSLKYISNNNINGDIVECGVYRGGSLALISKYSKKFLLKSRIFGFDTFEDGFANAKITEDDVSIKGRKLEFSNKNIKKNFYPMVDVVKKYIEDFSQNMDVKITLIKGDVLETLKENKNIPEKISFLRLDTDLYTTTKFQLEILYPKLVKGGILHIDDYGFLPGVRKAVDEYFKNEKIWLHRIDLSCRLLIKK